MGTKFAFDACPICGGRIMAMGDKHVCCPKKLATIDASRKRDDDATIERRKSKSQRLNDGFLMLELSGDDYDAD